MKPWPAPSLFTAACGLFLLALPGGFQLREPEPAAGASEWIRPTQIDILLVDFTTAVQRLNVANYERSFSGPDYRFVSDPTSAGSSPALFINWSVPEGTAYFTSLRRRSAASPYIRSPSPIATTSSVPPIRWKYRPSTSCAWPSRAPLSPPGSYRATSASSYAAATTNGALWPGATGAPAPTCTRRT